MLTELSVHFIMKLYFIFFPRISLSIFIDRLFFLIYEITEKTIMKS